MIQYAVFDAKGNFIEGDWNLQSDAQAFIDEHHPNERLHVNEVCEHCNEADQCEECEE